MELKCPEQLCADHHFQNLNDREPVAWEPDHHGLQALSTDLQLLRLSAESAQPLLCSL